MNFDGIAVEGDKNVVVLPMHMDEYLLKGDTLYVNFFRVQADMMGEGPLTMANVEFKEWVEKIFKAA